MATQMQKVFSNHKQCIQHGDTHAKAPMQPIIATTPLELLHIDFMSIEMTMELDQPPNVVNCSGYLQSLYKSCHSLHDPPIKL